MRTLGDNTVISGLRWYASDRYYQATNYTCTVGCVGGQHSAR